MVYSLSRNVYLSAKGDKQAMKTLAGILVLHGTFVGILGLGTGNDATRLCFCAGW